MEPVFTIQSCHSLWESHLQKQALLNFEYSLFYVMSLRRRCTCFQHPFKCGYLSVTNGSVIQKNKMNSWNKLLLSMYDFISLKTGSVIEEKKRQRRKTKERQISKITDQIFQIPFWLELFRPYLLRRGSVCSVSVWPLWTYEHKKASYQSYSRDCYKRRDCLGK